MPVDNNKVVKWFEDRKGRLTYSMYGSRNGDDGTADCSGSVTWAIYKAGGTKPAYLYSTVTLDQYLKANGYKRISVNSEWYPKRGDVVMMSWGNGMASSGGAGGHVGVMKNDNDFISVDYWTGGQINTAVSEHNMDVYFNRQRPAYFEVWRLNNGTGNKPANKTAIETFKADGNWYGMYKPFRIDEVKFVNGINQVINYELAGDRVFSWTNNGIPVAILNNKNPKPGDYVKVINGYNYGTIDAYDYPTNGAGIIMGVYGMIWFNADALLNKI